MGISEHENIESIISKVVEHFLDIQFEEFNEEFFECTDQWERGILYVKSKSNLTFIDRLFLALGFIHLSKYNSAEKIIANLILDLSKEVNQNENLRLNLPDGVSLSIEDTSNRISLFSLNKLSRFSFYKHNEEDLVYESQENEFQASDAYHFFREGLRYLYHFEYDLAEQFFSQALKIDPENSEFRFHKTIAILNEGYETDKALDDLKILEESEYKLQFVKYGLALCYYESQYYDKALSYLDEAIVLLSLNQPLNLEEEKLLSKCYYLKGRIFQNFELWEIAYDIFSNINKLPYPIPSSINFQIGLCLEKLNRVHEALESFEKASSNPRDIFSKQKILERSARCYFSLKEYEMALNKVKQAISISSYCFESRLLMVKILVTKKDYLKAEKAVRQIIALERQDDITLDIKILLGDLLIKNQKFQKAREYFAQLIQEYKTEESAYLKLQYGISLFHIRKYRESIQFFNDFLKVYQNVKLYGLNRLNDTKFDLETMRMNIISLKSKAIAASQPEKLNSLDCRELNELAESGNMEAEILLIRYCTQKPNISRNQN
ncbi:tetratricopeptide repeat protein [Sediminitomix flava]|uniref:Tetratricopeptide repeat protein n=2 Tax=Sediminitomix flava TaxID=379075 RepID=A0A315ZAK3_SEDFL|nr:tetratricopeptide repeat protein [Sediminitomix flava]